MVSGSYLLLYDFHMMTLPSITKEQKWKGYQRIRTMKTFEYKNARSDFNVAITDKSEKQYVKKFIQLGIIGP